MRHNLAWSADTLSDPTLAALPLVKQAVMPLVKRRRRELPTLNDDAEIGTAPTIEGFRHGRLSTL